MAPSIESVELTDAGRHALQARADVLVLIGLLQESGHPVASSPLVAEIAARYAEAEDEAPPTIEEVVEDALARHDWLTIARMVPDLNALAAADRRRVARRISTAFVAAAEPPCHAEAAHA